MSNAPILEISKNDIERIRVEIVSYLGRQYLATRVFRLTKEGDWRPSRKGLTLRAETWEELLPGIQAGLAALAGPS